jgi:hypothetical protein
LATFEVCWHFTWGSCGEVERCGGKPTYFSEPTRMRMEIRRCSRATFGREFFTVKWISATAPSHVQRKAGVQMSTFARSARTVLHTAVMLVARSQTFPTATSIDHIKPAPKLDRVSSCVYNLEQQTRSSVRDIKHSSRRERKKEQVGRCFTYTTSEDSALSGQRQPGGGSGRLKRRTKNT